VACNVGFVISRLKVSFVIELAHNQRSCPEEINRHHLEHAFAQRQYGPAATAWEPRALRVLVIEDDADTAECMARLVRLWGHDVRQATTARTGLEEAFAFRPDFVLLDIGMPTMDGCSLVNCVSNLGCKAVSSSRSLAMGTPSNAVDAMTRVSMYSWLNRSITLS
jgi:CheY-like chemotaxis protein